MLKLFGLIYQKHATRCRNDQVAFMKSCLWWLISNRYCCEKRVTPLLINGYASEDKSSSKLCCNIVLSTEKNKS